MTDPHTETNTETVTDAERIVQLESELAHMRSEMQAFAATVSHDLRAPLRHITAFGQLLQDEAGAQLQGEPAEFLGHIQAAAQQLGGMLDALLALSRVGTSSLHLEPVALQEVLAPLVRERQAAQQGHTPRPTTQWQMDCGGLVVLADAALLKSALAQLLDNALKFSRGRVDAAITVLAVVNPAATGVTCTVHDNGIGFQPDQAGKLFKPFIRLHPSSQFEGQGMGLALVAKSVQRMGGTVRIAARLDAGCTVTLQLPRADSLLLKK